MDEPTRTDTNPDGVAISVVRRVPTEQAGAYTELLRELLRHQSDLSRVRRRPHPPSGRGRFRVSDGALVPQPARLRGVEAVAGAPGPVIAGRCDRRSAGLRQHHRHRPDRTARAGPDAARAVRPHQRLGNRAPAARHRRGAGLANTPCRTPTKRFWNDEADGRHRPHSAITESLRHWVNDGLMALFFFIVGLEIKREVLVGEMRYPRQAALPIAAAVGGATVPALVYLASILGGDGAAGLGHPDRNRHRLRARASSAVRGRVRPLLLVFLTAFAIVDDILAVAVDRGLLHASRSRWPPSARAGAARRPGRRQSRRVPPLADLRRRSGWQSGWPSSKSGIHATLAGVLVAMIVPARSWINPSEFLARGRQARSTISKPPATSLRAS